jgi:hypothetical protein
MSRIRFLSVEEGGWTSWAADGIRPQLRVGEISTSCVVRSATAAGMFEPGVEYEVELHLMFWDHYGHLVDLGQPVVLLEGSRVIAEGAYIR